MCQTIFTKCETCNGTGEYPDFQICYMCNGYGTVEKFYKPIPVLEHELKLIEPEDLID